MHDVAQCFKGQQTVQFLRNCYTICLKSGKNCKQEVSIISIQKLQKTFDFIP